MMLVWIKTLIGYDETETLVRKPAELYDVVTKYPKFACSLDKACGIDDTSCRMLLPREISEFQPGDLKGQRLAENVADACRQGHNSKLAKMWVCSGLNQVRYDIFDFCVSRHREGPEEFFANGRCNVQGDCYSGNSGIVRSSNEQLEFVACWGHARRKVVDSQTYKLEGETLLKMI